MQPEEIEKLEAINSIYDVILDLERFDSSVARIFRAFDNEPNAQLMDKAFEQAARIAQSLGDQYEVDVSRDIGVIVIGLNQAQEVAAVPSGAEAWLGGTYTGNKTGIGLIVLPEGEKLVCHLVDPEISSKLPVDKDIRRKLDRQELKSLAVVHSFEVSDTATKALTDLYNLTPSEIAVCIHLSQGLSMAEIAAEKDLSRETIKTHLKNIYAKTGVNRQTKLVRLLTQIFAASALHAHSLQDNHFLEPDWKNGLISLGTLFDRSSRGERICYSKFGDPDGQPFLFIHHAVGSRWHSRKMAEAARDKNILMIKPDRPGFGHSDPLPAFRPKLFAEFYQRLLDVNQIESARIIAYGIGGRILLEAAPYFRDRIEDISLWSFVGGPDLTISEEREVSGFGVAAAQWIWRHPKIMRNFLRIMSLGLSNEKKSIFNLRKHYSKSAPDMQYLDDLYIIRNVFAENKLSGRQDFLGGYHDHLHLHNSFEIMDGLQGIDVHAFYGACDIFANFDMNETTFGQIEDWKHYCVDDEGQLLPNGDFAKFLSVIIDQDRQSGVRLIGTSGH